MLNPVVFAELDKVWGPHTVNRFASFHNHELLKFYICSLKPGSVAVNAFTLNWTGDVNWWCHPIHLMPRVNYRAQVCVAKGMLIVPCWLSAPCWHLICQPGGQFAGFVTVIRELALTNTLFLPGLFVRECFC